MLVLARGVGSTHLAGATIDVLGYADEAVDRPVQALPRFAEAHPGHPYARLPADLIAAASSGSKAACLATEVGSTRTSCCPRPSGWRSPRRWCRRRWPAVISAREAGSCSSGSAAQGLHPAYLAEKLRRVSGVSARAIELTPPLGGEADVNASACAREQPAFRDFVVRALAGESSPTSGSGFPAVLGIGNAADVWRDLEMRLERPVFEVPTLPPLVPGIRLFGRSADALRQAGGRILLGSPWSALRSRTAGSKACHSGGRARTSIGRAGWCSPPAARRRRDQRRLLRQDPRSRVRPRSHRAAGGRRTAAVPADLLGGASDGSRGRGGRRPASARRRGRRPVENVLAAGATLAGAVPWREAWGTRRRASATGYAAAGAILEGTP